MFDNKTGILYYDYQLELDTIINAICNISFDIGIQIDNINIAQINEIEYAKELFVDDFLNVLSIRKTDLEKKDSSGRYNYSKEAFFSEISNYYNNNTFNNHTITNYLKGSDILLINKSETFLYISDEKKSKNRIIAAIKNGAILNDIIDKIKNIKIKNSLKKINLFEHFAFYNNTIKISKKVGQPVLPVLNFNFLDSTKLEVNPEDLDNYWINIEHYKKKYGVNIPENSEISLVIDKDSNQKLGLLIENNFIPYPNVDLVEYVLDGFLPEYYWLLFKLTYAEKWNKSQPETSLVQDFKKLNKSQELNQLLSFLKNNLYLNDKINIGVEFEDFFNKVSLIEKLEHLDEYEFLIPRNVENETALGIYSKEKKGKSYNLLHWLNHQKDKNVLHFRGHSATKKNEVLVSTLKPEICFYFLERYFEDLLESVFIANGYDYLSNINFSRESSNFKCEIDFLVTSNNKFYYIEAKTKLSKYYIEEFLKRASKIIDFIDPMLLKNVEIEFILLGGYSDDNVKDFQYFIDSDNTDNNNDYNIKREKLNSTPYRFSVPIPDKKDKEITCIAEPEYEKLRKLLLKICPK